MGTITQRTRDSHVVATGMTSSEILEVLRTGSDARRAEAIRTIGPVQPDMPRALLEALCTRARSDPDPAVRVLAVDALSVLGRHMSFVVRDVLLGLLHTDRDTTVRVHTAAALRQFGGQAPAKLRAALAAFDASGDTELVGQQEHEGEFDEPSLPFQG